MMPRVRLLLVLLAALGTASSAHAQSPVSAGAASDSGYSWIVRVAGASGAEVCPCASPSLRVPHARELYIVGVGLRHVLHSDGADGFEVDYDPQFIPFIASHGTADEHLRVTLCQGNRYCAVQTSKSPWTTRATGIGILPIGFTALAPIVPHLRFQLRGAAGAVRMSKPVPLLEGHKFNFLAEASSTLELRVSSSLAITGGMVFNHISNGGTASVNPGMNSRMLEFGIVRR
jgi:hypothetical protein